MNYCKDNQNANILKLIRMSKHCHGQQITQSFFNSKKNVKQLYTCLFKDLKDLSPMLENAPLVEEDLFHKDEKGKSSETSGYVWKWP